ncbi:MAG: hypothetical protein UU88_C0002G0064 [Parcubacteria group bacterium GW2011_GWC1_42_11]|uniref:Uncharacterized protein n=1 Tax=Candidatus Nomurabacteria bacterium GW2011_GWC2_42_20 TaxID=1618756 RepID=A0A0G1BNA8_9BACT|nr:MAG: hypothetical protein UU88_C0002G0064 [Parcubacteria group bacterium GW2011_GWC1_42_11]KKS47756.1 MAG: hypothetical protein UV12_C0005G0031 [Candidatus Nomurabacteria bacterium GW2011_GWC2_42_20]KKS58861.1 MAG: hypothetical protein UV24_C0014G0011 [Candidatus Nomurabacteria bacterium GW2011_GWA2_42_41]KKT09393.1 MAG: hypothetical protein UV86_C0008G0014 [Candidatus Nomurabacteria bacterium GW2011_GWB1_43_20]TAN36668.1 MAG: hypothetical protein EPN27_01475 [Patescibacteria group bacterium
MREIYKSKIFVHSLVFLGLFALAGYVFAEIKVLILFSVLSFAGAVCGAFVRLSDQIEKHD